MLSKYRKNLVVLSGIVFVCIALMWMFIFKSPKVEIYTVYHKEFPIYKNDIVIPIHAGRSLDTEAGKPLLDVMIGDDTGDNISEKNNRFSELTALYWMQKNSKADYVGLMHYRRYFELPSKKEKCADDFLCAHGLTQKNVEALLKNYDIIVPKRVGLDRPTMYEHYSYHHGSPDLDDMIAYMRMTYPEMNDSVNKALSASYFIPYNMFIMKREILDEYAVWMFDILGAIEEKIERRHFLYDAKVDLTEADAGYWQSYKYSRRAPGFLSEHLFTIWLHYYRHKYKIHEVSVEIL